jgi:large subunit ribosomal protein L9
MEVILVEKIEKLGNVGDVVNVKNGFARNYLVPQKKALRSSPENKKYFEAQKKEILARNEEISKKAEVIYKKVNDKSFSVIRQASDEGRLFGSVMPKDIAERISELSGVEIGKSQVVLVSAIRETGVFDVKLRLHADYHANVKISVARSEQEAKDNLKAPKAVPANEEVLESGEEAVQANEEKAEAKVAAKEAKTEVKPSEKEEAMSKDKA